MVLIHNCLMKNVCNLLFKYYDIQAVLENFPSTRLMFLQPLLVKGFTKILKKKTMLDHKHLKTNQKKSKHMFILLTNKQIGFNKLTSLGGSLDLKRAVRLCVTFNSLSCSVIRGHCRLQQATGRLAYGWPINSTNPQAH